MLTGRHMVRDVSCKNCDAKLGWVYEFATEDNQRYKEGRVILERALVTESEGIEEHISHDGWKKGNNFCREMYTELCIYFNDKKCWGMSLLPEKCKSELWDRGFIPWFELLALKKRHSYGKTQLCNTGGFFVVQLYNIISVYIIVSV